MLEASVTSPTLSPWVPAGRAGGLRAWHQLEEESVSGDLLTNIFAGGTVDSEWCFLTGYSQYEDFRAPVDSYVWYLRNQAIPPAATRLCLVL